jgi:pimeloyl-ACP methyl ester carboxylesterase
MANQKPYTGDTKSPSNPPSRTDNVDGARERLLAALPVTERFLELNGIPTAVLEGGKGPEVILLHGPGGYAAHWLRVIPSLVATHRVIVPDLPGHGASGTAEGPLDAETVMGWLDDLIECTCDSPPALVGHVIGGAIAARFAARHGERLGRLVLVDSLGLSAFQPAPEFGAALQTFMSRPSDAAHDQLWQVCAHDLDALRANLGERWHWIKAYNVDRAKTPELGGTLQHLMEGFGIPAIPSEELERIAVPTDLIWGRQDLATPVSVAEAAGARYGWPLHIVEDAADDPSIEQPEAFLVALRTAMGGSPANDTAGD